MANIIVLYKEYGTCFLLDIDCIIPKDTETKKVIIERKDIEIENILIISFEYITSLKNSGKIIVKANKNKEIIAINNVFFHSILLYLKFVFSAHTKNFITKAR